MKIIDESVSAEKSDSTMETDGLTVGSTISTAETDVPESDCAISTADESKTEPKPSSTKGINWDRIIAVISLLVAIFFGFQLHEKIPKLISTFYLNISGGIISEEAFVIIVTPYLENRLPILDNGERDTLKSLVVGTEKNYSAAINFINENIIVKKNEEGVNDIERGDAFYLRALIESVDKQYEPALESFHTAFDFLKEHYTLENNILNCVVGMEKTYKRTQKHQEWITAAKNFVDSFGKQNIDLTRWHYKK